MNRLTYPDAFELPPKEAGESTSATDLPAEIIYPSQNVSTAVAISSDTSAASTGDSVGGRSYQLGGTGLWWDNNCVSVRAARGFCPVK